MKRRTIELSYNNHEEMFDLPINPAEFEFTEAHNNQKITLLNIGEANLIGHRGLVTGSLSSFFPSADSPFARYADREPMEYIQLLKKWKSKPQPIRVIISDCDFNLAMSIDNLTYSHREGDKDVYFTLELSEYRFLTVPAVKQQTQAKSQTSGLNTRPNTQAAPKTHTVVYGDCLWNLAKKYYGNGAQYTKIYNANKGIIGSDPNIIKVGQKLVIPT